MKIIMFLLLPLLISLNGFCKDHNQKAVLSSKSMVEVLSPQRVEQLPNSLRLVPVEILSVSKDSISFEVLKVRFHIKALVGEQKGLMVNNQRFLDSELQEPEKIFSLMVERFGLTNISLIDSSSSSRIPANVANSLEQIFAERPNSEEGSKNKKCKNGSTYSEQRGMCFFSFNLLPRQPEIKFTSVAALGEFLSANNIKEALKIASVLMAGVNEFLLNDDSFNQMMSLGVFAAEPKAPSFSTSPTATH